MVVGLDRTSNARKFWRSVIQPDRCRFLQFMRFSEGFTEMLHYQRVYGFERLGQSQRMILTTEAAARLIGQYGGRPPHE
jgi:hypothetical protein